MVAPENSGQEAAVVMAQPEGALSGSIASSADLEEYASLPAAQRPAPSAALRGVLAETALTGVQRFDWRLLQPLLHRLVDLVLADFGLGQEAEMEGPPRPPPPGFASFEAVAARLHSLLDGHESAPFTLQRLCEVLLEPRKQYARLDKVALAIEKLLMVTSTRQPDADLPPPPPLSSLSGVNCNPPSPYLDGRPPQVLDPQQHQALLQQQAQAMAAAQQQHLRQQQQQQGRPPIPNGLEEEGPTPMEGVNGSGGGSDPAAAAVAAAAAAAAEAMQLEANAFVEAALADASANGVNAAGGMRNGGDGGREGGESISASPQQAVLGDIDADAAAQSSVPPTPPDQQPVSPGPDWQQEQQQPQVQQPMECAGLAAASPLPAVAGPGQSQAAAEGPAQQRPSPMAAAPPGEQELAAAAPQPQQQGSSAAAATGATDASAAAAPVAVAEQPQQQSAEQQQPPAVEQHLQ